MKRTSTASSPPVARILLLVAAILTLSYTSILAGNQPQVLSTGSAAGFRLQDITSSAGPSLIMWSAPGVCSGELPRSASIGMIHGGLAPGQYPAPWKEAAAGCEILDGSGGDAVHDDTFLYYFSGQRLRKKPLGASPADPHAVVDLPLTLPILPPEQSSSALEMTNGSIYWGRYSSDTGNLALYKAEPAAGTGTFVTTIPRAGAEIRKMRWVSLGLAGPSGALLIQLHNGKLYRFKFDGSDIALLATGVTDFVAHSVSSVPPFTTSYTFASKGSLSATPGPNPPAGSVVRINTNTAAATTIYTATGNNQVQSIAVDPGTSNATSGHSLYIAEAPVDCFQLLCVLGNHVIRRSVSDTLTNNAMPFQTILNDNAGTNLVSDGDFLYYLYNGGIRRICTDADPVLFNMAALDLEVTQAVQDMDHNVVLVSGREGTIVRTYANVFVDNTGSGPYLPFATLEASVDGVPLPGSPFYPTNNATVDTESDLAVLRSERDRSFLFELPPLPIGTLRLEFHLNPNQNPAETDTLTNNTLVKEVVILPGTKLCLVTVPIRTGIGTYNPNHWSFPSIMERAQSLLPFSKIELHAWQPLATDNPFRSQFLYGDPFFPNGFDTPFNNYDGKCLNALERLRKFSDSPSNCSRVHWHGLVKDNIVNFGGLGKLPGRSAISEMRYGGSDLDSPDGGKVIAHELGHNFGRGHVLCGGPDAHIDLSYPYNPCSIGTGEATGFFGYDPVTQKVVLPGEQGDFMSYGNPAWVSDYSWNAIYWNTYSGSPGSGSEPPGSGADNPILFVAGEYNSENVSARLGTCFLRRLSEWPQSNVIADLARSDALLDDPEALKVEALDRNRRPVSCSFIPLEDSSERRPLQFNHFIPFPEEARYLRLSKAGKILLEQVMSAHAPTVSLERPLIQLSSQSILLEWEAEDLDGDPLTFLIQYSANAGQSWFSYLTGFSGLNLALPLANLPGGNLAQFRVTASDGFLTGSDTSDPLIIPKHEPDVRIAGVFPGERIPFGSKRRLLASAIDVEDGTEGVSVSWTGTIPPSNRDAIGIDELAPGSHQVTLTATDRDGMSSMTTLEFDILPPTIPEVADTPVIDGLCSEAAWAQARLIRLTDGTEPRYARLLHSAGSFYVSLTNLSYNTRGANEAEISFDLNSNGIADAADLGFAIDQNGVPTVLTGGREGMTANPDPPHGATMAVSRGESAWCAEFCIPDNMLGGWNQNVPLFLAAGGVSFPSTAVSPDLTTWTEFGLREVLPAQSNRAPVADAGPDQVLTIQNEFTYALSGDQSFDPDGDALTYSWSQVLGPTVMLSDPHAANPSFTIPAGTSHAALCFQLVVNDGTTNSGPDDVVVALFPAATQQPSMLDLFTISEGEFRGRLSGMKSHQRYFLQRSRTLDGDWITIDTITADGFGNLNFHDLVEPEVPGCFYQAIEAP